jgi:hypothetical protein
MTARWNIGPRYNPEPPEPCALQEQAWEWAADRLNTAPDWLCDALDKACPGWLQAAESVLIEQRMNYLRELARAND